MECGSSLLICWSAIGFQIDPKKQINKHVYNINNDHHKQHFSVLWSHDLAIYLLYIAAVLWHNEAEFALQVTPPQRSRRSGTKSPGPWPTRPISPVCWTLVPSAWPPGSAWNALAKASAHAPATYVTWAPERRRGGSSRNRCSCRSQRPRLSTNWCPTMRPIRCVHLTYVGITGGITGPNLHQAGLYVVL